MDPVIFFGYPRQTDGRTDDMQSQYRALQFVLCL